MTGYACVLDWWWSEKWSLIICGLYGKQKGLRNSIGFLYFGSSAVFLNNFLCLSEIVTLFSFCCGIYLTMSKRCSYKHSKWNLCWDSVRIMFVMHNPLFENRYMGLLVQSMRGFTPCQILILINVQVIKIKS